MGIPDERRLLTRADAAAALAISTDALHRLIKNGEVSVVRIGRSVLVPLTEVQSFIDRRLTEGQAETRAEVRS